VSENPEVLKWKTAHAAMVVCAEAAEERIDALVARVESAEAARTVAQDTAENWYRAFLRVVKERDLLLRELREKTY
jgi:hypothetical protein